VFFASVETDRGEIFRVLLPDGTTGGKALLSFYTGLKVYCSVIEAEVPDTQQHFTDAERTGIRQWFLRFEANAKEPICRLTRLLDRSLYSGDWDYDEDEYELYLHRYPEGPPTEDEFRNAVQQVREKWVDVRLLLAGVDELVKMLVKTGPEATWWYEPGLTEVDFRALTQTLSLADERGAERIRINIT
jgi:hypothetical protein